MCDESINIEKRIKIVDKTIFILKSKQFRIFADENTDATNFETLWNMRKNVFLDVQSNQLDSLPNIPSIANI